MKRYTWEHIIINDLHGKIKKIDFDDPDYDKEIEKLSYTTKDYENLNEGDYFIKFLFDKRNYWIPKEFIDKLDKNNNLFVLVIFILGILLGFLGGMSSNLNF